MSAFSKWGMDVIDNGVGASLPDDFRRQRKELWEETALFIREMALLRADSQHSNIYLNSNGVVADQSLPMEAKALLNAIAGTESPGYNVLNGGERFDNFLDHPRRVGAGGTTTAAGRYQFVKATWDRTASAIGASDFSPKNQDRGAWWLAQQDYTKNTGRDLLADIQAGEFALIREGLSSTWEGLHKISDAQFAKAMQRGGASKVPEGLTFANYRKLQNEAVRQANASETARRQFATALSNDPMGHFSGTGQIGPLDLNNPGSFQQRAEDFQGVLEQYGNKGIVINKPLSKQEVTQISEVMKTGSTDEKMSVLASLSELGDFTEMALDQIKEGDGRTGYVAEMVSRGDIAAQEDAAKILEGLSIIEENPEQAKAMLDTRDTGGTLPLFNDLVGLSLLNLDGPTAAAVKDVSDALYLRRQVATGKTEFDQELYEQAVRDVLGGEIHEHNSVSIVLPIGVDEQMFEEFLVGIKPEDLTELSLSGAPPMFGNGEFVEPEWFEDEGRFIQLGRGEFGFVDVMGNKLADAEGNAYIMRIDRESIDDVIERQKVEEEQRRAEAAAGRRRPQRASSNSDGAVSPGSSSRRQNAPSGEPSEASAGSGGRRRRADESNQLLEQVRTMSVDEMEAFLEVNPIGTIPEPAKTELRNRLRSEKQKQLDGAVTSARAAEAEAQLIDRIPSMTVGQMQEFIKATDLNSLSKSTLELLRDTYEKKSKKKRDDEIEEAWRKHREGGS